jgi:hypothetical protein
MFHREDSGDVPLNLPFLRRNGVPQWQANTLGGRVMVDFAIYLALATLALLQLVVAKQYSNVCVGIRGKSALYAAKAWIDGGCRTDAAGSGRHLIDLVNHPAEVPIMKDLPEKGGQGPETARHGPFLYLWLALSTLLNLTGMASIVQGFIDWAQFLAEFINLYRVSVREPLSWAAHLAWPSSWPRIPGLVIDWLCVSAGFFLAMNIFGLIRDKQTFFGWLMAEVAGASSAFKKVSMALTHTIHLLMAVVLGPLLPLVFLGSWPTRHEQWRSLGQLYFYWLSIVAAFVSLVFLNWQLKRAGIW